jgi:hypothetical protein
MKTAIILVLTAVAWPVAAAIAAEPVIGNVARVQGPAVGISGGASESLVAGSDIRLNEKLTTGADARLEVVFDDGTRLTVGERSMLVVDDFIYAPAGVSRLHAAVTGPLRYVSGKLAVGGTRQASVTTPFALIGVRGTDFWGGPIDGANGVVVFEGSVSVSNAAGAVVLSAPGQGTNVAGQDAAPGPVTVWPADKVGRAVATVTFR